MPVATTNRTQLAYIAETAWGTTPGTGSMQIVRYTGESLDNNYGFTESAEIIADRMTTDMVRVSGQAAGEVNYELSYGMFDPWIEAALGGTWTTNVVKTGATAKSFTIEKQFLDITQFLAFTGQRVDSWRMELRQGQIASGSFGFVGKASNAMSATTVRTGTTAATTDTVMAPVDSIQVLTEGGSAIAGCSGLTFNLSNSLRTLAVINSIDPIEVNAGRQRITGTMDMYFQDATAFAKFRNQTETAIIAKIGGAASKNYNLNFPRVKFTKASIVAGGGDQDMMVSFEWTALRHAASSTLLEVTRTP
jgi:hypothetical protein